MLGQKPHSEINVDYRMPLASCTITPPDFAQEHCLVISVPMENVESSTWTGGKPKAGGLKKWILRFRSNSWDSFKHLGQQGAAEEVPEHAAGHGLAGFVGCS